MRARALYEALKTPRWGSLAVGLVAVVVYANSLPNRFAYDDYHIIVNNEQLQTPEALPGGVVSPYWPGMFGRELGLWRPTTQALLGIQWIASGGEPWLFHVVNVLAHAVVTVLVLLLLTELISWRAAFVGALLFAVHPVHVEAVANIVGIAELASALFFLWACLVHVRGPAETGWPRAIAMALMYAVAFGAKESAVTLPGALFLLDAARGRLSPGDVPRYVRERWRAYFALVIAAAVLLLVRWEILGRIANPLGPLGADLLLEIPRIWTIAEVWGHYVRLFVLPLDLSSDYAPEVIPISIGWHLANGVGVALALAILGVSLWSWGRGTMGKGSTSARAAGFGVVWFMITMSPVSNVFFLAGVLLAERTLYLPSVGLVAAAGWLFARMATKRPRVTVAVLVAVVTLASARTWVRNPTWQDNAAMLNALVGDYPHSGRSQWVLGDAFLDRGRTSQALLSYRLAMNLLDSHYQVMTDVGQTMIRKEMYRGAEGLLRHAWRREPQFALAPGLLAEIYSDWGRPEQAERLSRVALTIDDRDPLRPHIISWSLAARGRYEEAGRAAEHAVRTQGFGNYWQAWLTQAYLRAAAGDTAAALDALVSGREATPSTVAKSLVDSTAVALLGIPLPAPAAEPDSVAQTRTSAEDRINK